MEKSGSKRPSKKLKPETANDTEVRFVKSSGNVFTDLGVELSREDYLKIEIARAITNTIKHRGLTQAKAAEIVGTDQPKISAITRGQLDDFSAVRLIDYLLDLGRDVRLNVCKEYKEEPGKISVCG